MILPMESSGDPSRQIVVFVSTDDALVHGWAPITNHEYNTPNCAYLVLSALNSTIS